MGSLLFQGLIDVKSVSSDTISHASHANAKSIMRLSSKSATSNAALGGSIIRPPEVSTKSIIASIYDVIFGCDQPNLFNTRAVFSRICGEQNRLKSLASKAIDKQSAAAFCEAGGTWAK